MTFRKVIIFILIAAYYLNLVGPVLAAGEFTTNYKVSIEANDDLSARVTQNISLSNNLSHVYATSYSITIDKTKPTNIKAEDNQGVLETDTQVKDDKTTITVNFRQPVVGKDEILNFKISYDSKDLIKKTGQIWEIVAPKITNIEDINTYELSLIIPQSFGKPAYLSPEPVSKREENGSTVYVFDKVQVNKSAIVGAFGDFQIFDFKIRYFIKNPLNEKVVSKIALPPDTEYQKIEYNLIDPTPVNVETDGDNNWLGVYELEPQESKTIIASGQVRIFSGIANSHGSFNPPNTEDYLKPQKYWEVDDPQIVTIATELKTPEKIYNYVVNTLKYDASRVREGVSRLGAKYILNNPDQAICTEFTDLFVALSRAAGIPARELNGYSYADNTLLKPLSLAQDVLHSWPEYWDENKKIWIPVDPTWQKTTGGVDFFNKLDMGHFVFAIHGLNSVSPVPAGGYKDPNYSQKDIEITFGKYTETENNGKVETIFNLENRLFSEFKTQGYITIRNLAPTAIYDSGINIYSKNLEINPVSNTDIKIIPPYGFVNIPVNIVSENKFFSGTGEVIIDVNGKRDTHTIKIQSLLLNIILPIVGSGIIVGILVVLYNYYRHKRKSLSGEV